MTPHGPLSTGSDICQPFLFFCNSVTWPHATRIQEIATWNLYGKITCSTFSCHSITPMTAVPTCQLVFLSFFVFFLSLFWWADFGSHLGADRHKKAPLAHCWFKVLAEQILGSELRAKSWPFCSLLSSANFFLGLSESIKELPECSHQSFNYSW